MKATFSKQLFQNNFFKTTFLGAGLILAGVSLSQAALVYSDTFTATEGTALVGHTPDNGGGAWATLSGAGVNDLTINNNAVSMTTSGHDASSTFSSAIAAAAGTSFYFGANVNISGAQATGDYFLGALASSTQDARLYAKSTTGGFLLGMTTVNSGTVAYGSGVLSLNTLYQVVIRYDFVSGLANDTAIVFVNPVSGEENNVAYVTATTGGTDPTSITGVLFRQGTATSAATLTADDLMVGATFEDIVPVVPIPEPVTWALIVSGTLFGAVQLGRLYRRHLAAR